jgi:hypothetical protein
MNFSNIKAASVDLVVDDQLLTTELCAIPEDKWLSHTDPYTGHTWKTIWLTINNISNFTDFKKAKALPHSSWFWDETLHIPYIKSLVESLPINTIGMVRGFMLNGSLVMHVDSDKTTPTDLNKNLALTLASKMSIPMLMEGNVEVKEKYVLFNDSIPHGFPQSKDEQISIRIFGEFDYDKFKIGTVYE